MSADRPVFATIQEDFDLWGAAEKPKNDLLLKKLQELREQFIQGQIDESSFFRRLIDETRPAKTLIHINKESMELKRTPKGQIKIASPGSTNKDEFYNADEPIYEVVAVIDFDAEGKLKVQGRVYDRGKLTRKKTIPTVVWDTSANDVAREMINNFLRLGDYWDGDYSDLVDLPEEESYPED